MSETAQRCERCGGEMSCDDAGVTICVACSAAAAGSTAESPPAKVGAVDVPRQLGQVRLNEQLGRGASGVVYRGYDPVLGRAVAVKFLTGLIGSGSGVSRFLEEARAAAAVRHPNLVQVYQADIAEGIPYLVLEYVPGTTLASVLRRCGPMPAPLVLAIVQELSAALDELHRRHIVHRDVKPANVLVDREGHVRLADLGIAARRPEAVPGTFEAGIAGTPLYMAPEAFEGRTSARSDVYSLAVTCFELLTGDAPYAGTATELRHKHLHVPLPIGRLAGSGIPAAAVEVVERAAHKQASFRYKTPADFARALGEAMPTAGDGEQPHRDLSLLVARRSTPRAITSDSSSDTPTTGSYAQTLDRLAETKRVQKAARDTTAGSGSRGRVPEEWHEPSEWKTFSPAPDPPRHPEDAPPHEHFLCIHCGYDLHGQAARCPECWHAADPAAVEADRLPWERRPGRFVPYWQTVWMACFDTERTIRRTQRDPDLVAALRFRLISRIVLWFAFGSLILTWAVLLWMAWSLVRPDRPGQWQMHTALIVLTAVDVAFVVVLALSITWGVVRHRRQMCQPPAGPVRAHVLECHAEAGKSLYVFPLLAFLITSLVVPPSARAYVPPAFLVLLPGIGAVHWRSASLLVSAAKRLRAAGTG